MKAVERELRERILSSLASHLRSVGYERVTASNVLSTPEVAPIVLSILQASFGESKVVDKMCRKLIQSVKDHLEEVGVKLLTPVDQGN